MDGSTIKVIGTAYITFTLGKQNITQLFVICKNITQPVILGRDFLTNNNVIMRFDTCSIELHGECIKLDNHNFLTSLVKLTGNVLLKPQSTVTCFVKVRKQREKMNDSYLLSRIKTGILHDQPGVFPLEGMVDIKSTKKFPIKIVNTTSTYVKLKRGSMIAKLEELDSISSINASLLQEINDIVNPESSDDSKPHITPPQYKDEIDEIIKEFEDIFARNTNYLPATDLMEMKIELTDDTPINVPSYRIPLHKTEQVDAAVNELLEADIIRHSSSPYNAPLLILTKAGKNLRIVNDFRKINRITKPIAQPLPNIDSILSCLHGSKFFTKLDLRKAFYCMKIREQDKEKTAFSVNHRHFEYNRVSMGLRNSGAVFSQLMNKVFSDLYGKSVIFYLDDILVHSKTFEEHMCHLREALQRLRTAKLSLNPDKCEFVKFSVEYLGHTISANGISPSPDKVTAMQNTPPPRNLRALRGFIGLFSYYRRYIKDFSKIASPLIELTKKNVKFSWDERCESAFQTLKNALINPPILVYPDVNKQFILQTDASNKAIGAVLLQEHDGVEKPIIYISHRLNHSMRKLPTIELEMFAIIYALGKLDFYLSDTYQPFIIRTDHRPLTHFFNVKHTNKRLAMWSIILSSYNAKITYIEGSKNKIPDYLSRHAQVETIEDSSTSASPPTYKKTPTTKTPPTRDSSPSHNICVINTDTLLNQDDKQDNSLSEISELEDVDAMEAPEIDIPDIQDIKTAQQNDEKLSNLITQIQNNNTSEHVRKHFVMLEDILYYISENECISPLRIVIPEQLKSTVLKHLHDLQGHLGIQKTYQLINQRYYWSGLFADVTKHVSDCVTCTTRSLNTNRPPMQATNIPKYPFEIIAIDISGPFVQTNSGNRYILTIMDLFSSWVEAVPIPSKSSEIIANVLLTEIIPRFSCPRKILTDNGLEMIAQSVKHITKVLRIKHITTSIYHPEANGQIERMHRVLHDLISKQLFNSRDEQNWDLYLPFVLSALRTSINATTKHSSHYLLYQFEPMLPLDTILLPRQRYYGDETHKLNLERMHVAYSITRDNIKKAQTKRIERANSNSKEENFSPGDPVFLYNKAKANKHDIRWNPYFRVVRKTSPVSYVVRDQLSGKLKRVHVQHLKRANLEKWKIPKSNNRVRRNRLIYARSASDTNEDADDESDDRHLLPQAPPLLSNQASDSEDNLPLIHFLRNPITPPTAHGEENPNNHTANTHPPPSTPHVPAQHKVMHKRKISDFTSSDNLPLSHLKKRTKHNDTPTPQFQNAQYRDKANSENSSTQSSYADAQESVDQHDIMAVRKLTLLKEILSSL